MNKVLFSKESDEWETPQWLFDQLNNEFHFNLDPCASHENHKCEKYFTIDDDGLTQSWEGLGPVFVNPPYSAISNWVKKCCAEANKGETIVLLIPARTDTIYWHKFIMQYANELRFIKGRLRFSNSKNSAPFPSVVVVWDHLLHPYLVCDKIHQEKVDANWL